MAENRVRPGTPASDELTEKVIYINRVAKVVKGGRRFSFSALIVVGDGHGSVGIGLGKANEVPEAIRKGATLARKQMIRIPMKGGTIAHPAARRIQRGAGDAQARQPRYRRHRRWRVRAIMEAAGVTDVLAKSLGSRNPINVARATIEGLEHAARAGGREARGGSPSQRGEMLMATIVRYLAQERHRL